MDFIEALSKFEKINTAYTSSQDPLIRCLYYKISPLIAERFFNEIEKNVHPGSCPATTNYDLEEVIIPKNVSYFTPFDFQKDDSL